LDKEGNVADSPRETRVLDAVVSLVDSLLDDFDMLDLLTELTERCAELLDISAAGFLLADPLNRLRLLAATSEEARELELFQLQADEGPCVDCFIAGQPVSVANLNVAAQRWPQFVPAAVDGGFASVHAIPMRAAGLVLGALGLFGTRPGALSDADLLVGQTLAHIACVAILQADEIDRDATATFGARQPRGGGAGQGFPSRTSRRVRRGGVQAAAHLRPQQPRAPHRRRPSFDD
jgi:hypothetical protein